MEWVRIRHQNYCHEMWWKMSKKERGAKAEKEKYLTVIDTGYKCQPHEVQERSQGSVCNQIWKDEWEEWGQQQQERRAPFQTDGHSLGEWIFKMGAPCIERGEEESQQGTMHFVSLQTIPELVTSPAHHKCCLFNEIFVGKQRGIPVNVHSKK